MVFAKSIVKHLTFAVSVMRLGPMRASINVKSIGSLFLIFEPLPGCLFKIYFNGIWCFFFFHCLQLFIIIH